MFPLITVVGREGSQGAVLNDFRTRVPIAQQNNFGLFAIMFSCEIDGVAVTCEVQRAAAEEWRNRYPEGVSQDAKSWEISSDQKANELLD